MDSDSARDFLQSLERQRGTRLLSENDYREMRDAVLLELARGPRLKASTLLTLGVVGLILFGFLFIGLAMLLNGPTDWLLAVASGGCLGLWGYVVWQYVTSVRHQARLSLRERLEELEELRRHALITQLEFERIYAAVHSSRGIPLEPEKD
jgi:hypothetical protein